jgi:hypothetical protein
MMNALARVQSAGSGPSRLRAVLRRDSEAVLAVARDHRAAAHVRWHFPETLLGAELADVMGENLRRALRFWEREVPTPVRARVRGEAPVALAGPGARRRDAVVPAAAQQHAPVATPAASPAGARASRPALSPAAVHARDDVPSPWVGVEPETAGRAAASVSPIDSPLRRALRTYWSTLPAGKARSPADGVVNGSQRQSTSGADRSEEMGGRASTREPVTEHRAARRTFIADAEVPPTARVIPDVTADAARPAQPWRMTDPAAMTRARAAAILRDRGPDIDAPVSREAWRSGGTGTDWLAGDLADQLADILREQAVREGVDLT